MKVLITGASGFIGGFLVEEALRRGYETWAGIRASSNRKRLQDSRIRFIDLRYDDPAKLTEQLTEHVRLHGAWDYIIHNAGLIKTLKKENFYKVNAEQTRIFLQSLQASGCSPKKFILMSSLSSFGPGDEKTFTPIKQTDPQRPNTVYGKSKMLAEKYVREQTGFPYVILYPTGVYGPGERDYFMEIQSIQSGIDMAAGFTPQQITFIYVKDLARVAFLAIENEKAVNKAYFVADGDVHTDESFARMIQDILGKKWVLRGRLPLGVVKIACWCSEMIGKIIGKEMTLNTDKYIILKQRNWICDITPLQDDLNFKASYPLRKGLEESIDWYRMEGWLKH